MSRSRRLFGFAIVPAFCLASGLYLQSSATAQNRREEPKANIAAPVTKWEYRIVVMEDTQDIGTEKELNRLGNEGFEVAFVTSSHRSRSNARGTSSDASPIVYYTLKRVKP
jgi:hypothetical protein